MIDILTHVTFNYLIPATVILTYVVGCFAVLLCLHFNYHYFLIHGEILWNLASDEPSKVEEVKKINALKWEVGVLDAVLVTASVAIVGILASIVWPVTILILIMLVLLQIMKFVFRGRHRKLHFTLKLKGIVK